LLAVSALAACGGSPFGSKAFQEVTVQVTNPGGGNGRVVAPDPNVFLDCHFTGAAAVPAGCSTSFSDAGGGGTFTLEATPDSGHALTGWSGCSSAAGLVCTLTFVATGFDVTFNVQAQFGPAAPFGTNLLRNADFDSAVAIAGLPTAPGGWQGDQAQRLGPVLGAHSGTSVLQFVATGVSGPGATAVASEQWQIIDLTSRAGLIDSGRVRADASAWFSREVGDSATDTRFDVRLLAFAGTPSDFPASYANPAGVKLLDLPASVLVTTPNAWQQASTGAVLPSGTRYLVVSVYAFENVEDDAVAPEFDGHYVDDTSLILTLLP
jgi:hypothetical protein